MSRKKENEAKMDNVKKEKRERERRQNKKKNLLTFNHFLIHSSRQGLYWICNITRTSAQKIG